MAVFSVARLADLVAPLVIAPERYHPGRMLQVEEGVRLGELVVLRADLVSPGRSGAGSFMVLDTSDVEEGFVRGSKPLAGAGELGSTKKRLQPGDVLVSRLRPYLRQVGYCDQGLATAAGSAALACSTEFFVLRARDGNELAFLVPYLLSSGPQRALAAAVEGGHHPRFSKQALIELPVPRRLLEQREQVSRLVIEACRARREGERLMARAIRGAEEGTLGAIGGGGSGTAGANEQPECPRSTDCRRADCP